jgi:hypothetical protein
MSCPGGQPRRHTDADTQYKLKQSAEPPDTIERATVLMLTVTTAVEATTVSGGTPGQIHGDERRRRTR